MQMGTNVQDLQTVLDSCRAGFELRKVPMATTDAWEVVDGALQHRSRGFFSVVAVAVQDASEPLVLMYQPQAAVTGVITCMVDGERRFLLQGRPEPGCLGEAQYGPTIQSTPANYMRLHGGQSTPFVEEFIQFNAQISLLEDTTQLDLGERYLFKTKRSIILDAETLLDTPPAFIWGGREAIYDAIERSAFLNIDLRSAIAVSPWSSDEASGELCPRNPDMRRSLDAPIRSDVLGRLHTALSASPARSLKPVPLETLDNWVVDEGGLREKTPRQNFEVGFYEVSAAHREVTRWVQPLVNSGGQGMAVLACRENDGFLEFWIPAVAESGLSTGVALAPSFLSYPGADIDLPAWLEPHIDNVWAETIESDEGGRFFQDASRYMVVRCDGLAQNPDGAGEWLRLSELKACLRASTLCTIQLRGLSSHLLAVR